jgi:hypothetical protein
VLCDAIVDDVMVDESKSGFVYSSAIDSEMICR